MPVNLVVSDVQDFCMTNFCLLLIDMDTAALNFRIITVGLLCFSF